MPDLPQQPLPSDNTVSEDPSAGAIAPVTDAKNVSDILLSEGLLTPEQYEDIKVKSATQGQSILSILQDMQLVPEDKLAEAQASLLGIPFIDLATVSFFSPSLGFSLSFGR